MDYTKFTKYPFRILGINESYNEELTAIEEFVISEMNFSGALEDVQSILPAFIFFKFCENKTSSVDARVGEQIQGAEFTFAAKNQQIRVWNRGVESLKIICAEKAATASKYYLSKISLVI